MSQNTFLHIPAVIAAVLLLLPITYADETTDDEQIRKLNERISELQQQLTEMQQKHRTEIRALREQIGRLAEDAATEQQGAELRALREAAQKQAAEAETDEQLEEKTFTARGLGLQKLNPEISVAGDVLFSTRQDETTDESSDFDFRVLDIHVQSWLDPYTLFKGAIGVTEDSTKLGEGYITLHQIRDDLNLTIGKFRQQFGVVNRWHKHALDQVNFPLALREIFGNGGLNQTGLSLDWLLPPAGSASQQLTFQLTDGDNSRLFGENSHNRPCMLAHYKNYRDLSKDTYLEYGLTGLVGFNDLWPMQTGPDRQSRQETFALGADLSILWEPTEKMRYRNLQWRSEAYYLNKKILAPEDADEDRLHAWGLYSYLQSKISRTVEIGIRGDFYVPDTKNYADLSGYNISPLAVTTKNPYVWQISPYITWWQSPFVKFRLEYDHADGKGLDVPKDVLWLQAVFAAGPHKHERY